MSEQTEQMGQVRVTVRLKDGTKASGRIDLSATVSEIGEGLVRLGEYAVKQRNTLAAMRADEAAEADAADRTTGDKAVRNASLSGPIVTTMVSGDQTTLC